MSLNGCPGNQKQHRKIQSNISIDFLLTVNSRLDKLQELPYTRHLERLKTYFVSDIYLYVNREFVYGISEGGIKHIIGAPLKDILEPLFPSI